MYRLLKNKILCFRRNHRWRIEKVEQEKNEGKEKLESTDGFKDTIKDIFQSNSKFLEEEFGRSAVSGDEKLFLNLFSKSLSIITSKNTAHWLRLKKIVKLAIANPLRHGQNKINSGTIIVAERPYSELANLQELEAVHLPK